MSKTYTKGNVIVEEIKIGDIHYEYEYGLCCKSKVLTLPESVVQDDGSLYWTWKSEEIPGGRVIDYGVNSKYSHYSANLYDYEAYKKL